MCLCNKPPQVPKLWFQPRDTTAGSGVQLEAALGTRAHPYGRQAHHSTCCKGQDASAIPHGDYTWVVPMSSLRAVAVQQHEHSHCICTCVMFMTTLLPLEKTLYKDLYHQFEVNIHFKNSSLILNTAQHPVTILLSLAATF